ncbi:si:dkey-261l7.2 [Carcharodon carcharias]|uniref:si:dkey-261l7.2 n=1 Tax=Carcharodon carcharias TaxID=13397 RepID=UPI001B7DA6FA|nr:si:dkey-261l7.2 [Carcharodon carcharias]XP_041044062.1 si:dkey-261l7.2 [Carcharodon carcharias]XP_041044063.1 si:dkey-261l7.2 [Carcharodon carcharias]XP_041044064.1 si:dkey-261l7.2 [Carcharodon carcharias]XP_041044065.1 si:dkey-261l7.2 [Carcharodon carcharias]
MPQLTAAAVLQIGLLISALPLQYILSRWSGSDSTQRIQASRRLINNWNRFKRSYLNLQAWKDWLKEWSLKERSIQQEDPPGESPAMEVFRLKENQGYFADSLEPRSPRPPAVKYRVGQVFRHKQDGYYGAIVGWDEKAKAPEEWLDQIYPSNMQNLKNTPHYKVLVHTVDGRNSETAYIPESDMIIVTGVQVYHPLSVYYFSMFDGDQYIMMPWLLQVYPHD